MFLILSAWKSQRGKQEDLYTYLCDVSSSTLHLLARNKIWIASASGSTSHMTEKQRTEELVKWHHVDATKKILRVKTMQHPETHLSKLIGGIRGPLTGTKRMKCIWVNTLCGLHVHLDCNWAKVGENQGNLSMGDSETIIHLLDVVMLWDYIF